MNAVHLAGPAVQIYDRVIQRCMVCGYKLIDADVVCQVHDADIGTWVHGALVEISGDDPIRYKLAGHFGDALPADFCLPLVERGE